MEEQFAFLTPHWLGRAHIYHGEQGPMRYRFKMDDKEKTVEAATYTEVCFEKAKDVESRTFSWDEAGVAELRRWLGAQYEAITARSAAGGAAR
ncbi:MAG: hypothetical protein ACI3WR_03390 [Oscillospiraceae bacterium]